MRFRDFGFDDRNVCREEVTRYLELASQVVDVNQGKFEDPDGVTLDDSLEDVLQSHYACYIDNCAVGSYLSKRFMNCDYVAGYSMGIYSALYHCGAVSFQDGLMLMRHICSSAHQAVGEGEFGMGVVAGLKIDEVQELLLAKCPEVEVADICGPRVVIFSGRVADVERVLDLAIREGALQARLIPVRLPFHSSYLKRIEGQVRALVDSLAVRAPKYKLVSCVSHSALLTTDEDVRREIVMNVTHPMNWYKVMQRLLAAGVDTFLECGMSENLHNLVKRNVKGSYAIYTSRQFDNVLAAT